MPRRLPTPSKLALGAALATCFVATPVWSQGAWASAPTPQAHHTHHSTRATGLSGKWSGSYSGSLSGTFTLTWEQSGKKLNGIIKISGFNNSPTTINGTVRGGAISFGTVGSQAITYSGSFSNSTMSGTWKIKGDGRVMGSGSWKASKAG